MSSVSFIGLGSMARAIAGRELAGGNAVEPFGRDAARRRAFPPRSAAGTRPGHSALPGAGDMVVLAVPYASAVPVVAKYGDALAGKVTTSISNTFNADATGLTTPDGASERGRSLGRSQRARTS